MHVCSVHRMYAPNNRTNSNSCRRRKVLTSNPPGGVLFQDAMRPRQDTGNETCVPGESGNWKNFADHGGLRNTAATARSLQILAIELKVGGITLTQFRPVWNDCIINDDRKGKVPEDAADSEVFIVSNLAEDR